MCIVFLHVGMNKNVNGTFYKLILFKTIQRILKNCFLFWINVIDEGIFRLDSIIPEKTEVPGPGL